MVTMLNDYVHVKSFNCWNVILIDFVVIMLCLTCFKFNSAVSLVVTDVIFDAIKTDYQR